MSNKALNWAYAQNIENPLRKFVLVTLADGADHSGYIWKHYSTIADMCGMSRRSVIRHVKSLSDDGFLVKETRNTNGHFQSNIYRLNIDVDVPKDHPLRDYCSGDSVSPPSDSVSPPSDSVSPPSDSVSLIIEPPFNPTLTKKEKKALTRDEFMREVDKAHKGGEFNAEFSHLTESEIHHQAMACWDFMVTELKEPQEGSAHAHLRLWMRKGMKLGAVRKPSKEGTSKASQSIIEGIKLQPWQERIKQHVAANEFIAWLMPLRLEGNKIIAPSSFVADWVKQNYGKKITAICGEDIVFTYQQEKEDA